MQTIDKAVEKFDALGNSDVAEQQAVKRLVRLRACGILVGKVFGSVGLLVFAGGARQDGIEGGVNAVWQASTSVLRNGEGEWDMPFFDIISDEGSIGIETSGGAAVVVEVGSDSPSETAEVPITDPALLLTVSGIECPDVIAYQGGYVSVETLNANSNLTISQADEVWQTYFSLDNPGVDPHNVSTEEAKNVVIRDGCIQR